jgi:hypothetical protein
MGAKIICIGTDVSIFLHKLRQTTDICAIEAACKGPTKGKKVSSKKPSKKARK